MAYGRTVQDGTAGYHNNALVDLKVAHELR